MLYVYDLQAGRNLFINAQTERFLGKSARELFGAGPDDHCTLLHPDDHLLLQEFRAQWNTASADQVFHKEYRLRHASGEYRWITSFETVLARDAQGRPSHILGTAVDIHAHKLAEANHQRIHPRAWPWPSTTAQLGLWTLELATQRLGWNAQMFSIYGLDPATFGDDLATWRSAVLPEDLATARAALQTALQSGQVFDVQFRARRPNGQVRWINASAATVRDATHQVTHLIGVNQDITEAKRAEAELHTNRALLEGILRATPAFIYVHDLPTNRNVFANAGLTTLLGYTPQHLQAMGPQVIPTLLHPENAEALQGTLRSVLAGQDDDTTYAATYRLRHQDGTWRWVQDQGTVFMRGEDGQTQQILGTVIDITERKAAEDALRASEARYRSLFDGATNPIVMYDAEARFLMLNAAARGHLPPEAWLGQPLGDFFPEKQEETLARLAHVFKTGETFYVEDWLDLPQGRTLFWSVFQPVRNAQGVVEAVQVISHDITAQHKQDAVESEREKLSLLLNQERDLSKLRSRLLDTIAHEFRTPLTIIATSSAILATHSDRLSPEKAALRLRNIAQQVERLEEMLDEISTLSRARQGLLTFIPSLTDIPSFCQNLLDEATGLSNRPHRLHLELALEQTIAVLDPNLLHHALMNLLSNAIKYSPEGGDISLTVRQQSGHLLFTVRDQGIGIPRQEHKRLFEPFYRASNVGTIRGTGLGLALVREAVELHEGTVHLESQLGQGSAFTLRLPLRT
ncbi:MAG: PAS domain-containing protein [Anaerolineae bacterium]|nr:PAS domain-containing protein [Anaerolineae bacterium]